MKLAADLRRILRDHSIPVQELDPDKAQLGPSVIRYRVRLKPGARVNEKSKQNQTALLLAASNSGSIETVRLLVAKGADPKVIGASGRTGLIMAANQDDLPMGLTPSTAAASSRCVPSGRLEKRLRGARWP